MAILKSLLAWVSWYRQSRFITKVSLRNGRRQLLARYAAQKPVPRRP